MSMTGQWKEQETATPEMQTICSQVKAEIEKKLGKKIVYKAIEFRAVDSQIHYIAKVHLGANDYIHLKMTQVLPCYGEEVQLLKFQYPKEIEDEIIPF
ncbi:cystatin-A1-like [Xyrauchen texanus]|uniref:cystatin-A1-like n=1 Tax=Xyrauchen texanus TaxID=154827 RepID=UPI002242BAB6|nr:cystatin-A1-like [Xyrauchen texanus]